MLFHNVAQFAYRKATGIGKLNCYVNRVSSYKILVGNPQGIYLFLRPNMNLYIKVVFLLLSLVISSKVIAQPAFKLTGYSYSVLERGDVGKTIKLTVKVYDKDSLLLFDTLWNYRVSPASITVTVYNQDGEKKSRYTKSGDKFEQNILFVRDAEGRLIEQVFTGSDTFRLKTTYLFDAQGRVDRAYVTSGSNKNKQYKSLVRYYYNDKGQEIAQETYVGKELKNTERKEYNVQGRMSKWTFSASGSDEKNQERFEYDSSGAMIEKSHYINDTLNYIQHNKWSGDLPESSQVKYYIGVKGVEYISFRRESIP